MTRASKPLFSPAATSAATLPSWVALCASIGPGTRSPIAKMCGTFVRCWSSTGTKPRSSTWTPAASAPKRSLFGRRPTATRTRPNRPEAGAFSPSIETMSPFFCALTAVTCVAR